MTLSLGPLVQLAWASLTDPKGSLRQVTALPLDQTARWQALLLIVVISVILGHLSILMTGGPGTAMMAPFIANPMMAGVVQLALLGLMVFAVFWIGRAMGGSGQFDDAILLVAWLQFILVCLQVAQTLAMFVLPALAGLIGIAGFVLFFWLLTNFVAELHGFQSLAQVFLMILLSMVGIAFVLSLVLSIIGVPAPAPSV